MAEMCGSAIAKGIPEIGFTEHYDLHPNEECRDWFKLAPWAAEIERCRAQFAGQLIIRAGIEIGEPHIYRVEAESLLAQYPFDYALGSLHWVGAETIFDRHYFRRSPDDAFRSYFLELERMTRAGGFDILSHFDVVSRVGCAVYGSYDPSRYEDVIRPVLRNCIERGIALDVNTKGLRSRAAAFNHASPLLTPGLDILKWYAEMGGERVTFGSDAHRPENIGADLHTALEAARAAGLTHLAFFEGRRARQVSFAPDAAPTS